MLRVLSSTLQHALEQFPQRGEWLVIQGDLYFGEDTLCCSSASAYTLKTPQCVCSVHDTHIFHHNYITPLSGEGGPVMLCVHKLVPSPWALNHSLPQSILPFSPQPRKTTARHSSSTWRRGQSPAFTSLKKSPPVSGRPTPTRGCWRVALPCSYQHM